jgi:hypothetical protein
MPLAHLSLISKGIPAKVNSATTEVTGDALHEVKCNETNEGYDICNTSTRDGVEGNDTAGDFSAVRIQQTATTSIHQIYCKYDTRLLL